MNEINEKAFIKEYKEESKIINKINDNDNNNDNDNENNNEININKKFNFWNFLYIKFLFEKNIIIIFQFMKI